MDMERQLREVAIAIAIGVLAVGMIVWWTTRDWNLVFATLLIGGLLSLIISLVMEKEYRAINLGVLAVCLIVWWTTRDWNLVIATFLIGALLLLIISWVKERRRSETAQPSASTVTANTKGRGEWRGWEEGGRIAAEVTTPEGYRQRISALGLDDVQIGINTVAEAKAALTTARGMEKQLRQVRQDINEDMVAIRAHYAEEESKAGEVKEVREERDWKLAPYNDVKVYIHDLLMQAIGAHVQATQFMEDERAKQQAELAKQQAEKAVVRKADSSAVYCPACGKRVAKADAFCGNCGAGL